jgi:hypothetical protein
MVLSREVYSAQVRAAMRQSGRLRTLRRFRFGCLFTDGRFIHLRRLWFKNAYCLFFRHFLRDTQNDGGNARCGMNAPMSHFRDTDSCGCKRQSPNHWLGVTCFGSLRLNAKLLDERPPFLRVGTLQRAERLGVCRSREKISSPRSIKRDRTAGSTSASTAAAFSLLMISRGVPLGAKNPNQVE